MQELAKQFIQKKMKKIKKNPCDVSTPTKHQLGDEVQLCLIPKSAKCLEFFPGIPCTVHAVHITPGKVRYDLDLEFYGEYGTRVYNIDSVFVLKP
jgi:hypothetical protein